MHTALRFHCVAGGRLGAWEVKKGFWVGRGMGKGIRYCFTGHGLVSGPLGFGVFLPEAEGMLTDGIS